MPKRNSQKTPYMPSLMYSHVTLAQQHFNEWRHSPGAASALPGSHSNSPCCANGSALAAVGALPRSMRQVRHRKTGIAARITAADIHQAQPEVELCSTTPTGIARPCSIGSRFKYPGAHIKGQRRFRAGRPDRVQQAGQRGRRRRQILMTGPAMQRHDARPCGRKPRTDRAAAPLPVVPIPAHHRA